MRVRIKNIGLIREADFTVSGLNVIMGPNNSGKSTIAVVVYAIAKASHAYADGRFMFGLHPSLRSETFNTVANLLEESPILASSADESSWSVPPDLLSAVARTVLDSYGHALGRELQRAFGSTLDTLPTRNPVTGRAMPMTITIESRSPSWAISVAVSVTGKVSVRILRLLHEDLLLPEAQAYLFGAASTDRRFQAQLLASELGPPLFADFPGQAHYLPAARAGLLQSHRLVAATMIQRSTLAGMNELSMPSLSGVVADFISEIILDDTNLRTSSSSRLAGQIERRILSGSVSKMTNAGSYPEILFTDGGGGSYPIHRTSSMVSELAPIVLLLKRGIARGELLIVEEPESHLHPRAQVQLARILFRLSRAGVTVMLTTHSEFFVAQLSNEVSGEAISGRVRKYPVESTAFWVDVSPEGSHLRALDVTAMDGIPEDSFTEVALELYSEQMQHQDRLASRAAGD